MANFCAYCGSPINIGGAPCPCRVELITDNAAGQVETHGGSIALTPAPAAPATPTPWTDARAFDDGLGDDTPQIVVHADFARRLEALVHRQYDALEFAARVLKIGQAYEQASEALAAYAALKQEIERG